MTTSARDSLFPSPAAFVNDRDFVLHVGDVRDVLTSLPPNSIDCCVTSPPYLGLRDYGMAGQIGLENTIGEFVDELVRVFAEVRRVLKPTGTLWLNLGDSYNAYNGGAGPGSKLSKTQTEARPRLSTGFGLQQKELKPKDLMGVPWRVALALQDDGWYLRSDIVWSKPNPMPESVTDRPTKAHEYVFMLAKGPRYYFDQDAVREGYKYDGRKVLDREAGLGSHENHRTNGGKRNRWPGIGKASHDARASLIPHGHDESEPMEITHAGRNVRSVWEIATQPYPEAHFATFPIELPRRCIAAGCPEQVCATCGRPRERIIEVESSWRSRSENGAIRGNLAPEGLVGAGTQRAVHGSGVSHDLDSRRREFVGWSDCGHNDYQPGVVLDPFMGSGTTALAARGLGRKAVGVELNPEYAGLCARRLAQQSLLAEEVA